MTDKERIYEAALYRIAEYRQKCAGPDVCFVCKSGEKDHPPSFEALIAAGALQYGKLIMAESAECEK